MAAGETLVTLIDRIEVFLVRVPLADPLVVFGTPITQREFIFVRVRAGGNVGTGYAFTRGLPLMSLVRNQIAPFVVGQPVGATRQIWQRARDAVRMIGEEGAFARALSVVDIALWDLLGQTVGVPLWRLLGGASAVVPCLAIMGYYRQTDAVATLRGEAERLVAAGYRRFKIPFGADQDLDQQRLTALREVVGPDALIALDASAAFASRKEAVAAWEAVVRFHPAFLEDPFAASQWKRAIDLAQQTTIPIAFGESIASIGIMHHLGSPSGVDIVRPDVTHQLGVTGYLQGMAVAHEMGVRIFPHYFPDLHAHLVGGLGGEMIEESPLEADTVGFHHLCATQPDIRAGLWHLTERAGFGIDWDEDALTRYRVTDPTTPRSD